MTVTSPPVPKSQAELEADVHALAAKQFTPRDIVHLLTPYQVTLEQVQGWLANASPAAPAAEASA